jgi:Fe-S-cluster containining protein
MRMWLHAANPAEPVREGDLTQGIAEAEGMALCRTCGACCSFSRDWPRFTTEDDVDLDRIPNEFVDHGLGRLRCNGDRCTALVGEVGVSTSCAIYSVRPDVCRACEPGDEACRLARHRFGL